MEWLWPTLIVLFMIGSIMDIYRLMKPSISSTVETLRIAIADVRKKAEDLSFPERDDVFARLAKAAADVNECARQLNFSDRLYARRPIRKELAAIAKEINTVRRIVESYLPEEDE
jgi:hypothetical protein